MRRLGPSVSGLSSRMAGFDPKPLHVAFVVDKLTLLQVVLAVRFIPQMAYRWTGTAQSV